MWIPYSIGFGFSILGSTVLVRYAVNSMWKKIGATGEMTNDPLRPYAWLAQIIGWLESILYTASWLLGKPEFVAVWLALKVAGKWGRWEQEITIGERKVAGRPIYNVFLIGSGLNVAFSIVGGLLVGWIENNQNFAAIVAPIVLILITLAFTLYAQKQRNVNGRTPSSIEMARNT